MTIKGILDEDYVNYKLPSMYIAFPHCDFKCGEGLCQNKQLLEQTNIEINDHTLISRYIANPLTKAIVCAGMEPFCTFDMLHQFLINFRQRSKDDIVIYTGYTEKEVENFVDLLKPLKNVIIKYGRYIPNSNPRYDEELGIKLASENQYAVRY